MMRMLSEDRYAVAAQEDRCAPRTQLDILAQLRPSGDKGFATVVRDLSLGGFSCEAVSGMRAGALCWLTLPGLNGLQARVVWNNGAFIGCEFAFLLNQAVHDRLIAEHAPI